MRRTLLLAAALAALTSTARAEPPSPGPDRPDRVRPGGPLFISPAGEPFRQDDGRAAWFAGADADHDGALSLAEFRADAMRFFKVLDADGDGVIGNRENQIYESKIAPEITRMSFDARGPGGGSPGGGGGGGPPGGGGKKSGKAGAIGREGAARFSMLNEPQPVRGADANLDYRITAEEWSRTAAKRFAILDKDGLGRLTPETLPQPPGGPPDGRKRMSAAPPH